MIRLATPAYEIPSFVVLSAYYVVLHGRLEICFHSQADADFYYRLALILVRRVKFRRTCLTLYPLLKLTAGLSALVYRPQ